MREDARFHDESPVRFVFEMPGISLAGDTTETFMVAENRWEVTYGFGEFSWTGRGESKLDAYLDLIANRINDGFTGPADHA